MSSREASGELLDEARLLAGVRSPDQLGCWVEYGEYPEQEEVMDKLWKRSAIRFVDRVHTPVMFIHGLNDNDVPTEQAEEYYVALKDIGDETILVLYPREGHGLRETDHVTEEINRSFTWYDRHFAGPPPPPAAF